MQKLESGCSAVRITPPCKMRAKNDLPNEMASCAVGQSILTFVVFVGRWSSRTMSDGAG
jgi:hypothetical protein